MTTCLLPEMKGQTVLTIVYMHCHLFFEYPDKRFLEFKWLNDDNTEFSIQMTDDKDIDPNAKCMYFAAYQERKNSKCLTMIEANDDYPELGKIDIKTQKMDTIYNIVDENDNQQPIYEAEGTIFL